MLPDNRVMLLWVLAIENGACCCWVVQWKRGTGKVGVVFLTRNKHLLVFSSSLLDPAQKNSM